MHMFNDASHIFNFTSYDTLLIDPRKISNQIPLNISSVLSHHCVPYHWSAEERAGLYATDTHAQLWGTY